MIFDEFLPSNLNLESSLIKCQEQIMGFHTTKARELGTGTGLG